MVARALFGSAPCLEVGKEVEQVAHVDAAVGRAGVVAIVEIGIEAAGFEGLEEEEEVVDVDAAVGRAGA